MSSHKLYAPRDPSYYQSVREELVDRLMGQFYAYQKMRDAGLVPQQDVPPVLQQLRDEDPRPEVLEARLITSHGQHFLIGTALESVEPQIALFNAVGGATFGQETSEQNYDHARNAAHVAHAVGEYAKSTMPDGAAAVAALKSLGPTVTEMARDTEQHGIYGTAQRLFEDPELHGRLVAEYAVNAEMIANVVGPEGRSELTVAPRMGAKHMPDEREMMQTHEMLRAAALERSLVGLDGASRKLHRMLDQYSDHNSEDLLDEIAQAPGLMSELREELDKYDLQVPPIPVSASVPGPAGPGMG